MIMYSSVFTVENLNTSVFELKMIFSNVFLCSGHLHFSCQAFLSVCLVTYLKTDRPGPGLIVGSANGTIKFLPVTKSSTVEVMYNIQRLYNILCVAYDTF